MHKKDAEKILLFSKEKAFEIKELGILFNIDFSDLERSIEEILITPLAEMLNKDDLQEETHGKKTYQKREIVGKENYPGSGTSKNK